MHAPGLWTWSVDDATCLYHEAPEGIVVADPLVPEDEAERFWRALDRDVERIGRPPTIVVCAPSTFRTADVIRARYPGASIHAPRGVADGARDAVLEDRDVLPGGMTARVYGASALLTCPCHGMLWTGDLLHGDDDGALAPGPPLSNLEESERRALATSLAEDRTTIALSAFGMAVTVDAASAVARALA